MSSDVQSVKTVVLNVCGFGWSSVKFDKMNLIMSK